MDDQPTDTPPKPTWRGVAFASAYGATVAAIGYAAGRGNLLVALLVMIAIGILIRIWAYRRIRHAHGDRPPWWKWL